MRGKMNPNEFKYQIYCYKTTEVDTVIAVIAVITVTFGYFYVIKSINIIKLTNILNKFCDLMVDFFAFNSYI